MLQREKENERVCIDKINTAFSQSKNPVNWRFRRIRREIGDTTHRTQNVLDFYPTLYNHDHSGSFCHREWTDFNTSVMQAISKKAQMVKLLKN